MHSPGYLQTLDCIDNLRIALTTPRNQQQRTQEDASAIVTDQAGLRGGDAVGGNATSQTAGGTAEGGDASGGDVNFSSPSYERTVPLIGGDARGGEAIGERATGGGAAGGSVRFSSG
jgi:hypothetical protein